MSDEKDDLFSESPSVEHTREVRRAVAPILADVRRRSRRRLFAWIVGGAALATAGVAGLVLYRERDVPRGEFAELDQVLFGDDDEALTIAEVGSDLDADFFEEMEEIENLKDEDFENS